MEPLAAAEEMEAPLHMEPLAAAKERGAPLHMKSLAAAKERGAPLHTHSFLFGCVLTGDRKVSFPGGGDDLREQLTLRTASLGLGARDELHVLEVLGETRQGSVVRVPVATLRPSLLTSVYLGGLELTPPVTFWLTAGTGPLYISGQHLVAIKERDAAAKASAEREAAAAKASAESLASAGKASAEREAAAKPSAEWEAAAKAIAAERQAAGPLPEAVLTGARLTMKPEKVGLPPSQSTDGAGSTSETRAVEQMKEKLVFLSTRVVIPRTFKKFRMFAYNILHTEEPLILQQLWEFVWSEKLNPLTPNPFTVEQMKKKLVSLSELGGGGIPTTMEKFRNFAKSSLRVVEPLIVQQLWEFVLSEKLNPSLPPLTVEQMKEKLVSISKRSRLPTTVEKFRKFAHFTLGTDEPLIVRQLWMFVVSEILHMPILTGEMAAPLTVEQMKEKLVSFSLKGRIPETATEFEDFAGFTLGTDDPLILQQLWEFAREKLRNAGTFGFWADD
ncbi:nucleophosmin-like [Ambystoma mexicanum]|uniref:nucleophosmin-like n=1 Tax=Ambystoma mexicanum TaxID=8296 RepID=UPI0037E97BE9